MLNTVKPIKVVCIYDTAIDHERIPADTLLDYARNRKFETIQPYLKSGSKPIIYNVKRLSRSVMLRKVMPITNENERAIQCFRHGVESVENNVSDSGSVYDYAPEGIEGDKGVVSDEELERFAPCDIIEIGTMIWYLSFLRSNSVGGLAVPPTSLGILGRQVNPSVPVNQTSAHQNSSKQQSGADSQGQKQIEQMPEEDENKSEMVTAVTVEVQG